MSFVSYAQNHEDVMLARVFRGLAAGFYLDVGAQDPRIDSVTKAFYDQGWHGINLEPVEAWCAKLHRDRPRDTNLCVAAGAAEGVVEFHEVVDTGLSTSSVEFARRHQAQGHQVRTRQVRVRTLDAICAEHGVEHVHFLKVDAEGAEADVLRGIDLRTLRPWVILVEATEPNSDVGTRDQWESLVLERGYAFAYDDGLNRFYLATEHLRLRDAFASPPNVFDDFIPRQVVDYRNHAAGLEHSVEVMSRALLDAQVARQAAEADRLALLGRYQATQAALDQASNDLRAIADSRSWRLTLPLRLLVSWARALRSRLRRPPPSPSPALAEEGGAPVASEVDPPLPAPLAISDDAERIVAEHPVLDPARHRERTR